MDPQHDIIWNKCLDAIRARVHPQSYKTWFKPITPLRLDKRALTIQVPSQFFYEWIDVHYRDLLSHTLIKVLGDEARLIYSVVVNDSENNGDHNSPSAPVPMQPAVQPSTSLNPRYTFPNFVEGNNNKFARAAALAVGDSPGTTSFNPLVVYGGVGLGKTHLIQAIGNHVLAERKARKIIYVSSEKFTIDFIDAIQNNKTSEFTSFYRSADVLLVDDVQFLINKERTQEEFFHTFNTIHQNRKQIVLSFDRPPNELDGIEERLISRFQWGLVVDIQKPDLETRIAILQRKAQENHIDIQVDVVYFLANNIKSNIRELEGALIRLLAQASLLGEDISLELAKKVLKDFDNNPGRSITIEAIQRIVCDYYKLPEDMLRAKTRKKDIAFVRQVAMFLCKSITAMPLKTIGLHFGGRDHSTVIHAVNTINRTIKEDTKVAEQIGDLREKIEISSF